MLKLVSHKVLQYGSCNKYSNYSLLLGNGEGTDCASFGSVLSVRTRNGVRFEQIKKSGGGRRRGASVAAFNAIRASCETVEETCVAVKAEVTVLRRSSGGNGSVGNVGRNGGIGGVSSGRGLVVELISSELHPNTVKGEAARKVTRQVGEEVRYEVRFEVPWTFGDISAITIDNNYNEEVYVKTVVLDRFHKAPLVINCNAWVRPNSHTSLNNKHFFFTDKGFYKKKLKIGDGYRISASSKHLVFAYYVTGHGFGHATRVVEVARHLVSAGHDVHVVTAAPEFVFTSVIQSRRLYIRKVLLDCGAVQADALTVDRIASLEKYSQIAVAPRASILATEVKWLNSINADLVVSDVVPVACRAAADAGIPSVCVTNFSWDFIYSEYVMAAGYRHHSVIWQIAEDYSHCKFLLRLPGYCPMPAFRDVIDVPLIVRGLRKSRNEVRRELGIGNDVNLAIFNFGGQPAGWKLKKEFLPDGWLCLVCGAKENQDLPPNFIRLAKDVYTPDMIAASECMIGKIGYGTVSEALAYKIPFVFVRRDYFNEEPFLRNLLECYQGGVEMPIKDMFSGYWAPHLQNAINLKPSYEGGTNGGEVVARVIQDIAIAKSYAPTKIKLEYPFVLPQIHN